jgi:hypothetical protein
LGRHAHRGDPARRIASSAPGRRARRSSGGSCPSSRRAGW